MLSMAIKSILLVMENTILLKKCFQGCSLPGVFKEQLDYSALVLVKYSVEGFVQKWEIFKKMIPTLHK